jgi:hypothetical protein
MGLKKLAAKVADYKDRLEHGQASEITPDHVRKVLGKLQRKQADLEAKLGSASDAQEQTRLERKLAVARDQIARAKWLLGELT